MEVDEKNTLHNAKRKMSSMASTCAYMLDDLYCLLECKDIKSGDRGKIEDIAVEVKAISRALQDIRESYIGKGEAKAKKAGDKPKADKDEFEAALLKED